MHQANVSFAKIVTTPSPTAWSQAYNAGGLFAVLSLTNGETEDERTLTNLGKQIINNFEAEFFTLENKSLTSIQKAVEECIKDLPENIKIFLSLAYIKDQVLYLLLYGSGSVLMKRDDKMGTLLEQEKENTFISASGYIKPGDLILLQTNQFSQLIKPQQIKDAFDLSLPSDIAEVLSPLIHNSEDGGASAIILNITSLPEKSTTTLTSEDEENEEETLDTRIQQENINYTPPVKTKSLFQFKRYLSILSNLLSRIKIKQLNIKKSGLLIAVILLFIALIFSIKIYKQKQQYDQLQKKFLQIYEPASAKYDNAMSIKSLNPNKAYEDLNQVKKIVNDNLSQFPDNSEQKMKLTEINNKIAAELSQTTQSQIATTKQIDLKESPALQALAKHTDANAVASNDKNIYLLTTKNILAIDLNTNEETTAVKNDNDWQNGVSLGTYNSNLYVLDTEDGILKFVGAEEGFGKQAYFTDTKPDLSNAVSMAVDGSIWILFNDGSIKKYTKGKTDDFTVKGASSLQGATQIATNKDAANIYVLLPRTQTITQIQKDGTFKARFQSPFLKDAKAIDVHESEQKIYILSSGKLYELSLK